MNRNATRARPLTLGASVPRAGRRSGPVGAYTGSPSVGASRGAWTPRPMAGEDPHTPVTNERVVRLTCGRSVIGRARDTSIVHGATLVPGVGAASDPGSRRIRWDGWDISAPEARLPVASPFARRARLALRARLLDTSRRTDDRPKGCTAPRDPGDWLSRRTDTHVGDRPPVRTVLSIALPGAPAGGVFFTNLEDKDRTLRIDVRSRRVTTTWLPGCGDDGPKG